MLAKDQIENTLKGLYNRQAWKVMLHEIFNTQGAILSWKDEPREIDLGNRSAGYKARNLFQLGEIQLGGGKIVQVFEGEVHNTKIASNKVGLRSLIQSEIIPGFGDAALAVFYSPGQTEWRFTFMSKWEYPEESGKVVRHETHPKKYTYVFGPLESNRTARDRFYELQYKPPALSSLLDAFSVTKLSREFFEEYREHYAAFYEYLKSSPYRKTVFNIGKHRDPTVNEQAEKPIRDFVKRLLGRIVFLYFVQKKGWMKSLWPNPGDFAPDFAFLSHLFQANDTKTDFYSTCLVPLFFETLNKQRKDDLFKIGGKAIGRIPYLNGGLFESDFQGVEKIQFKNTLFEDLFNFFNGFNFTINEDSPDEREVAVDPEMLGHIFENLIEENKKFGTFYTPKEVVHFMTQEALLLHLGKKLSVLPQSSDWKELKQFVQYKETNAFIRRHAAVIDTSLDDLKICDPAIGSGAFPMGILLEIYQMKLHLYALTNPGTPFIPSEIKETIIRKTIYGVDIDKGAIDIARLRFWLSLVVDLDQPRELPNFDYKFMQGDSLREEFEGIPLKLEIPESGPASSDLFGTVSEPVSFYGYLNRNNIDIVKLEEELYDAHDPQVREKTRKKLGKAEQAYIRLCIEDKLNELKSKIILSLDSFKRKSETLPASQIDAFRKSIQKKIQSLESEKALFEEKAELLKNLDVYEKPYFLWHLYFRHVFDRGGFDIVIANPPYGVKVDDTLYTNSGLGSKDSYGFFIKLAIDLLLKPQGTLVYIVSDTWLTIKSHFELRSLVLKHQLHKVVRLHGDTFGAVVNTCIFSLSKVKNNDENKVLAVDLTNLSTRKNTPEFREKLWHLENYTKEFNEKFAVYIYPQAILQQNSNCPIFIASPKLFTLTNDVNCNTYTIETGLNVKKNTITVNQLNLNNKNIEVIKFNSIANVTQGISTGQNDFYLRRIDGGEGYKPVNIELVLSQEQIDLLSQDEKINGVNPKKYDGKKYIVFDKGSESNTEDGWLPNYFVQSKYYIDWSRTSIKRMRSLTIEKRKKEEGKITSIKPGDDKKIASALRNEENWFKSTINFSPTGLYSPTFRLGYGTISQNTSSSILIEENLKYFSLGILCSRLAKYILKNFSNHTIHTQEGDIMNYPFPLHTKLNIVELVNTIIDKQKKVFNYDFHSNEQKEIDRLVYELYGLSAEDIQEVEYWWARRYPKLAKYADTRPRMDIRDLQEKHARLQELIQRGENKYCEFKSSLRLDVRKGSPEKSIEHTAFKNITGFLNSEGGTLFLGVDDSKKILGLEQTDFPTFSKPDKADEWRKHLDNLVQNFLGNKYHQYLKVDLFPMDGKTIATVEVMPSLDPVFLKNGEYQEFYIRRFASAIELKGRELYEYIESHWKVRGSA